MIVQGSPEWHALRCGKVTASRIADVIAKGRGGAPSASRASYAAELIAERLTGNVQNGYQSAAMAWGLETEPQARAAYSFREDAEVEPAGFVVHPHIPMAGASPDGLVGELGLVELKCPTTQTHIATLLGLEPIPAGYLVQMQWQMACTNREWCDFVSFDPRMPESMRLFVRRIERDGKRIAELEEAVEKFLGEIEETVIALRKTYEAA